jgi:hypothetical protein
MRSAFFIGIYLFIITPVMAQVQDSIIRVLPKTDSSATIIKKKKKSFKPTGDFDQRFSIINENKNVNIWGYRIGLLINDKYKVGIGAYNLRANFDSNYSRSRNITNVTQVNQELTFGTIFFEPFLFRKKRWEMSTVFELGYGQTRIDSNTIIRRTGTRPTTTSSFKQTREPFVPIGIGLSVNLIIPDKKGWHWLTYFGLNGMIGVRKVLFENDFKQNYDGYYWSIGTAIFIDRIFTDIFGKKKKVAPASITPTN